MLNVRQFYFFNFFSLFNCIYFSDDLHNIFFFNFLISLFYISPDTRPIHRDRYASGPSESVTDTATLNHEVEGLGATAIHDFITINTIRETGEVLNVCFKNGCLWSTICVQ